MSTKKTTADAVYEWLGTNPGHHSLDELTAALPNVKAPTLTKALNALVNDDQIHTRDRDGLQTWSADPAEELPVASGATVKADESDDSTAEVATVASSPSDDAAPAIPASAGPDARVMAIAFVLSRATTGLTPAGVANGSGIGMDAVWPTLAAMHAAGAAECDREFFLDPEAVWTAGAADPMTVNVLAAPDAVQCPMCGNQAPVPGRKTARKRSSGGTSQSGQYEPVRDMGAQVKLWLARHPDQDITPGQISKALKEETGHPNPNAYSSGAIRNVLFKLAHQGNLKQVPGSGQLTFHTPEADSRS